MLSFNAINRIALHSARKSRLIFAGGRELNQTERTRKSDGDNR